MAIVLIVACNPLDDTPTDVGRSSDVPGDASANVTRIVDGDTIEVETAEGSLTVRLTALNAPDPGECFADEGLDHLIDTLGDAKVELELMDTDQFGRALAHVFADRRHINLELVRMGLAMAATPDEGDRHRKAILEAEELAFAAGTGLWGTDACGRDLELPEVSIDPEASTPDPPGPDDADLAAETIVIFNQGGTAVDLSGWTLRDESSRHRLTFGNGRMLAPGEGLEISSNDPRWSPGGAPVWNNDGDMALLQDHLGTVVSRWRY